MIAYGQIRHGRAQCMTGARVESHEMQPAGALFISVMIAALGAVVALLSGAGWWSIAVAVAILAVGPILILALASRDE